MIASRSEPFNLFISPVEIFLQSRHRRAAQYAFHLMASETQNTAIISYTDEHVANDSKPSIALVNSESVVLCKIDVSSAADTTPKSSQLCGPSAPCHGRLTSLEDETKRQAYAFQLQNTDLGIKRQKLSTILMFWKCSNQRLLRERGLQEDFCQHIDQALSLLTSVFDVHDRTINILYTEAEKVVLSTTLIEYARGLCAQLKVELESRMIPNT